jgi:L-2-hydroxyglutarate oxidase LhgO
MCTGFDAPHDSLEFKLIRSGVPLLLQHMKSHNLPARPCGSLVVATTPDQVAKLDHIVAENHTIGTLRQFGVRCRRTMCVGIR